MLSYNGYCRSQLDCLILFEAACLGLIPRISQRLSEEERSEIKSGSIYIWDEDEAGIKRWTDGKSWSTSRVSGPFLIYRELEQVPGSQSSSKCSIKPFGLCKQSASITVGHNTKLHLIAYYSKEDVRTASLLQPSMDLRFKEITAFVKKESIGMLSPAQHCTLSGAPTPPPVSPPHTHISPPHMPQPPQLYHQRIQAVQEQPVHYPISTPMQQIHAASVPMGFASMYAPPSPPYGGTTPPLMAQDMPAIPNGASSALQLPSFNKIGDAGARPYDEDRRQLSLLDKSLFAY